MRGGKVCPVQEPTEVATAAMWLLVLTEASYPLAGVRDDERRDLGPPRRRASRPASTVHPALAVAADAIHEALATLHVLGHGPACQRAHRLPTRRPRRGTSGQCCRGLWYVDEDSCACSTSLTRACPRAPQPSRPALERRIPGIRRADRRRRHPAAGAIVLPVRGSIMLPGRATVEAGRSRPACFRARIARPRRAERVTRTSRRRRSACAATPSPQAHDESRGGRGTPLRGIKS